VDRRRRRVHGGSVTVPLVQRSRLTLVLSRSGQEDLVQVPARLAALRAHCTDVGVLVVGKAPYTMGELGDFFGTPAVWRVDAAVDLAAVAGAVAVAGPGPPLMAVADRVGRGGGTGHPRPHRSRGPGPECARSPGCSGGVAVSRPDPVLLTELTRSVQTALVADATARLQSGRARLGRGGQEALADKVLRQELQRIDTERLSAGTPRLTVDEERALVERVLALSVGLGPVELLLADESVEEVVASRFDLVFVYRSDGSVEPLEERLWGDRGGDGIVAGPSGPHRGADRAAVQRSGPTAGDCGSATVFDLRPRGMCPSTCRSPCVVTRSGRSPWATWPGWAPCPRRSGSCWRRACAPARIRLVFSGPTGSGKSTLVRACLAELGALVRVVVIEDTAELDFFDPLTHPNVESWEASWPTTRVRARSPRVSRSSTPCGTGRTGWCSARSAIPMVRSRC